MSPFRAGAVKAPSRPPPGTSSVLSQLPLLVSIVGFGAGLALAAPRTSFLIACVVALASGVVAWWLARLPFELAKRSFFRALENASSADLRELLEDEEWGLQQPVALLLLSRRGESIEAERDKVLRALRSGSEMQRRRGWEAVLLAFPEVGEALPDYEPCLPVETCRQLVNDAFP